MSGALVFTSVALVFAAAAQGIPLDCLTVAAKGSSIPGSCGTVTIGEMVLGRAFHPGHCNVVD